MKWPILMALALATAAKGAGAPLSMLPVRLVGVVVDSGSPARSACLVRCTYPEEATARVRPGDRACELAEILEVHADGVLIANLLTGRAEILAFTDDEAAAPIAAAPVPPVVAVAADSVTVAVSRQSMDYYLGNLSDLLASALATPRLRHTADGTVSIDGYEISQVRNGGLAEQVGLRNGDVLLDVNGQRLDSLATVIALVARLSTTCNARVTVLRKEQRLTFVLNTKGDRR